MPCNSSVPYELPSETKLVSSEDWRLPDQRLGLDPPLPSCLSLVVPFEDCVREAYNILPLVVLEQLQGEASAPQLSAEAVNVQSKTHVFITSACVTLVRCAISSTLISTSPFKLSCRSSSTIISAQYAR
jgi:hypothetical protein